MGLVDRKKTRIKMKYNRYTSDSPKVSEIGLGAWQLGANTISNGMSEKEAITMVHKALEAGINFYDTAPNYGLGTSEERLGKAFKSVDRDSIVVNTKFGHTVKGGNDYSAGHIRRSLEGSLKRLGFDYVDSLIFHNPPFEILDGSKNPHYEILEKLKEEGKIKAYGASVDTYEEMKLFLDTTQGEVVEAFFNILHQDTARGFEQAIKQEIGLIVKIPLDSGWLSGKYSIDSTFEDIRSRWSKSDLQTRAQLVEKVKSILNLDKEYSLAQAAMAFCLSYDAVSTVIPGNSSLAQLESNIASTRVRLESEKIRKLEDFYHNEVKELKLPW